MNKINRIRKNWKSSLGCNSKRYSLYQHCCKYPNDKDAKEKLEKLKDLLFK